jgi:hypothetical protein
MPNYVPVSPDQHRGMRWRRFTDYSFAREYQFAEIALPETPKLCMCYPIMFTMAGDSPVPIALFGLEPNQNAYLSPDFRWVATYTPAMLRGQPFRIVPRTGDQYELQVDKDHLSDNSGEPFFGEDNTPAPPLKAIIDFLQQVETGRRHARIAADQLAKAGVIKPLSIAGTDSAPPQVLPGLFTVDEAALVALPEADFAALRGSGAIKFAYHQILSLEMWPTLVTLSNRQRAHRDEISKRAAAIYQPADDGELQIDWSQFKPSSP